MKKIILLTLFAFMASMTMMAQSSMTDSQIIDYIQKEQKAGTSQSQIVVKLMQKGVTAAKLQEVRRKYEKLGGQSTQGARNLSGEAGQDRNRAAKTNQNASPLMKTDENFQNTLAGQDEQYNSMRTELGTLMPDSTETFDQEMTRLILEANRRKVFGRDIFNNKNLSFEPNMNIATPEDYVLGPGDQVFIDIYGASQKSMEATVTPDGDVNIEGYGPVQVSGLSVSKANQRLRNQLGQRYAGSKVRLTVGSTRTIMVNVMGEVVAPGTYTLSAFASVFHALYMAGGVSDIGTLRDIKVYRKDRLVSSVDIYDYILNGKLSGNVKLADNDVIVVGPYDSMVNITGKVKRPMFYEMKKGESLGTLLKYAGGFTGDAYKNSIRVVRKAGKEYSVWNVTEFDMNTFNINDEDSVSVDSVLPRYSNMVELRGAAMRPGMYQWGGDMTTVRSLMKVADGLRPEAMAHHVIVTRMREDRSLETVAINLKAILDGTEPDFLLCNEDVIFIPSKEESTGSQTLKIYGEVYYPGEYQYAAGMTVEDFILQAGGLKESAATERVRVSRRGNDDPSASENETRATRSLTYNVNLKKDFALGGEEGFKLEPFDEVYVGKANGYEEQAVVEIDGEVNYRGSYALPLKNARLSDLVAQAGGLTTDGYVKGARIIRKMDSEERLRRERQINDLRIYNVEVVTSSNPNVSTDRRELVDSLIAARYLDEETYNVGIDLEKALKKPGSKYDVTLRDGDKLYIPQYDPIVKVTGEVHMPTGVTYTGNTNIRYYIHAAGGYTGSAWAGHAFVVHPNGEVQALNHGAKVQPGSEVIVPARPVRNQNSIFNQVISAGSSLATVAALLITALK